MNFLSREQSRLVDRIAMEQFGFSGLVLMENAGRGAVDFLQKLGIAGPIALCCGKGNNGGDGFVMARHLKLRGFSPVVFLFAEPGELRGDAEVNFGILSRCEVPIHCFPSLDETSRARLEERLRSAAVYVDALLGTGAVGKPKEPIAEVIRILNRISRLHSPDPFRNENKIVLAVDVPSGLDSDAGFPNDPTVRADHTVTFFASKTGFRESSAVPFSGTVHVLDIGVPQDALLRFLPEIP